MWRVGAGKCTNLFIEFEAEEKNAEMRQKENWQLGDKDWTQTEMGSRWKLKSRKREWDGLESNWGHYFTWAEIGGLKNFGTRSQGRCWAACGWGSGERIRRWVSYKLDKMKDQGWEKKWRSWAALSSLKWSLELARWSFVWEEGS